LDLLGDAKFWEDLYEKSADFDYVKALVSDTKFDPANPKDVVTLALARSVEVLHKRQVEIDNYLKLLEPWVKNADGVIDRFQAILQQKKNPGKA
jgi:hypothetical protein